MTNSSETSSLCSINHTGIDARVWQIGAFVFPVLGIPGHLLVIASSVKTDRSRFHPTGLYFISIAVVELIYLSFMFWDWLDAVHLAPDPRKVLNCAYFYPFVSSTAFISLVLLVLLNIDRLHMIVNPHSAHVQITTERVLIKICLAYATSILFAAHYHFSVEYHRTAFIIFGQSCRVYEHARVWFYSVWPTIHLLCRLVPCTVLISCALYICWNRCQHELHGSHTHSRSIHRKQQTFSVVLLFLSIYTFFAVMPITVLQLFNHKMNKYEIHHIRHQCRDDEHHRAENWKLVNALFIMWEASTYMNKFYVRLIFSADFRRNVRQMCLG